MQAPINCPLLRCMSPMLHTHTACPLVLVRGNLLEPLGHRTGMCNMLMEGWRGRQAMETLQKLQRNLREEQKLIVQRMIVNHQCSLRPRQVLNSTASTHM